MSRHFLFSIDGKNYSFDLMGPLSINNLVVEITSRCNLRCTICPKSKKNHNEIPGRDMDMPLDIIDKTTRFVDVLKVPHISFIGTGEPTFRGDWREAFGRFAENKNLSFLLTSNLGLKYKEEDIDSLLQFSTIVVSLESADPIIQKEIRRSVDLGTIISNITMLTERAKVLGVQQPKILVNCTVSQRNVFGLKDLAELCIKLGVDQLNLSSLFETESASALGNHSIEQFTSEQLDAANQEVMLVRQVLSASQTRIDVQPRLLQLLTGQKEVGRDLDGQTRICLQPWGAYTVGADGQIFPCCAADVSFINVTEDPENIVDSGTIRQIRKQLLEGPLPEMCVKCSNAPLGTREDLAKAIAFTAFRQGLAAPLAAQAVAPTTVVSKTTRSLLIMHNCQTVDLGLALKEIFPDDNILHHPLPSGLEEPTAEYLELLKQALLRVDVLVTSNRGIELIKANDIVANARIQTILVPPIEFHAFHPDLCYVKNKLTGKLITHNYNSAIAVWGYKRNYDIRDTVQLFNKINYKKLGYLSAWKPSFEHLKAQFTACNLDFDKFYLHVKRCGVFMYSTNHPKSLCIVRLAKIIATKLGCDDSIYNKEIYIPDSLINTVWPVYPEIAEHLSLVEYADYWKFDRQTYIDSVENYVEYAFSSYRNQGLTPDDLEYLSRDIEFYDFVLSKGTNL